jgi:hypothetical protein
MLREERLAHVETLPIFGRLVVFETNSIPVMEAVERSFGGWRRLAEAYEEPDPICRVRIVVAEGDEGNAEYPTFRYPLSTAHRMVITTPGSVAVAETERHEAYAFVTTALVNRDTHFRYGVVEALALMLVTSTDRHPIHAATVAQDGAALLLAGPSGVGKSTLAYAASRAGLEVRGDEAAYVQRQPDLRLWGTPDRVRLSPAGATHFPELREVPPVQSINGKSKVIVRLEVHEHAWRPLDRMAVCLLSGGDGPVEVERVDAAGILHALTSDVEPGFDLRPEEGRRVAEALAEPGGWRVTLSQDPAEAVGVFEEMLRAI